MTRRVLWMVFAMGFVSAGGAWAGTINWNGPVSIVVEDTGGVFGGTVAGTRFVGQHSVPDLCAIPDCIVEPQGGDETNYVFPAGTAFVSDGTTQLNGAEASVNIQNNETLDADDVALLFLLAGLQANINDPVDVWTGASENADGSVEWEITYVSLDPGLYDNTDFRPDPPSLGEVDLVFFSVSEDDGGTEIFFVLPEPAATATIAAALGALGLLGGRRARRRAA